MFRLEKRRDKRRRGRDQGGNFHGCFKITGKLSCVRETVLSFCGSNRLNKNQQGNTQVLITQHFNNLVTCL